MLNQDIIWLFASTAMLAQKLKATKTFLSLSKRVTDVNPSIPIKIELSDLKKSEKLLTPQVQVWCGFLFISFLCSFVWEVTHQIFFYKKCKMFHPQLTHGSTWNQQEKIQWPTRSPIYMTADARKDGWKS